jgi:molecular chaperone GrpE (heat shock protein)
MNKYITTFIATAVVAFLAVSVFAQLDETAPSPSKPQSKPTKSTQKENENPLTPDRIKKTVTANRNSSSTRTKPDINSVLPTQNGNRNRSEGDDKSAANKEENNSGAQDPSTSKTIEQQPQPETSLLNTLIIFVFGAALFLISLIFHVFHILSTKRTNERVGALNKSIQRLQYDLQTSLPLTAEPSRSNETLAQQISQQLSQQINQKMDLHIGEQKQNLLNLSSQLAQVNQRLNGTEMDIASATKAIILNTQLASKARIQEANHESNGNLRETDRSLAIQNLERYRDTLTANANRLEPLTQEIRALSERLNPRFDLPAELVSQVQTLYQDIQQFDIWSEEAGKQVESLQRGSFNDRLSRFKDQERALEETFNRREVSVVDYIATHRNLLQQCFPQGKTTNAESIEEYEQDWKRIVTSAPDYLMDWFDDLFQLHIQASSVDTETAVALHQIKRQAREAFGKFDIQPEEVQIGQTMFDRRIHEAAVITQSAQFPANTVIGVEQCGFRRLTTGEALRRPKVIVAGAGAGR